MTDKRDALLSETAALMLGLLDLRPSVISQLHALDPDRTALGALLIDAAITELARVTDLLMGRPFIPIEISR